LRTWIPAVLVIFGACLAVPVHASQSYAMLVQCLSIPDNLPQNLWSDEIALDARMKGFLPEAGAPSLRMVSLLSQKSAVLLSMGVIRATCHDYRAGKVEESDADYWLYNAETEIRKFQDELTREALDQAASGDVSKMKSISLRLTDLLVQGRQDALLGEDELSTAATQSAINIFRTFYEAFITTCVNQSFDADIALAIERQRQMLGMGGDDTDLHCAYRHSEARAGGGPGLSIQWKTCGLFAGKWKVKVTGSDWEGEGSGVIGENLEGEYTAHFTSALSPLARKADITDNGSLTIRCQQSAECDCLQHPDPEACAGVDTAAVQWSLLAKEGNSYTGTVLLPDPSIHHRPTLKVHSVEEPLLHHSILWEGYMIKRINVDKPCNPDKP